MPHSPLQDLSSAGERWPTIPGSGFRTARWGDGEMGLAIVEGPRDCIRPSTADGLPGGVCPCPHDGYIFEGRPRARYPGSEWPDEGIAAGEPYFIPSGRVLIYEEASRIVELNPAYALRMCMEAGHRAASKAMVERERT